MLLLSNGKLHLLAIASLSPLSSNRDFPFCPSHAPLQSAIIAHEDWDLCGFASIPDREEKRSTPT
jgi:hypothetical protein